MNFKSRLFQGLFWRVVPLSCAPAPCYALPMSAKAIAAFLKPDLAVMGYGLFLAMNAAGVWGGVFPFLPFKHQTPQIVFWFFLAQTLVFSACYFASAVGSYFLPGPTRRFLVVLAALPYFLGWVCLMAAMYVHGAALPLFVAGGALLGLGSAGFFMLWQRLFAGTEADAGTRELVLGTAYASVIYFSLYLIPSAVTVYLIPTVFLPLFALAIILLSRKMDPSLSMFEDVPYEHPRVYRAVLHDYWRPALCVGAIGLCAGIMRSLAIGDPAIGPLVNVMSMGASLLAALAVLMVWRRAGLRMNVLDAYHMAFPVLLTAIMLLPLLPRTYERWLAAALYAVYSVAIMLMMVQCAQASRDRGINPIFIYGFFGGIVYSLHGAGFIMGTFAERLDVLGMGPLALVALVTGYVLAVMYFVGNGGFRRNLGTDAAATIELVALRPTVEEMSANGTLRAAAAEERDGVRDEAHGSEEHLTDRTSKRVRALKERYRLSEREAEVVELVARGNTVVRVAEVLVVSESTIRTHTRRIYAKLDVHKKQELLDLLEQMGV